MSTEKLLARYVESRPLAVLTRTILTEVLTSDLDQVFHDNRSQGYQRELLYSQLCCAIAEVVLGFCRSPNQAYNKLKEELSVSKTAFYEKLKRIEPAVCRASVQHSYACCQKMLCQIGAVPWEIVPGYHCKMIDGNHLEGCDNRLKELRSTWAKALPGTAVVVLDAQLQMAQDIFLINDGHALERTVFDEILDTVERKDLVVADSHYATIKMMTGVNQRGACFVFRQHGALKGEPIGRRKLIGQSDSGKVYEQAFRITSDGLIVRRITIELLEPTQDGDTEIHILSNLPASVSAFRIGEIYLMRHDVEYLFYLATTTLTCEVKGLNYPQSALFVFCVAMMAINCRQVLFALLAAAHGDEIIEEVSHFSLASEIAHTYDGILISFTEAEWQELVPTSFAARMKFAIKVAKHINLVRHKKAVRGKKKPPPKKTAYKNGSHLSVQKVLNQRK
jgi:hypothetical protein